MPKKALLVGIDKYENFSKLNGCIADANTMREMLRRNADHSGNYGCKVISYGEGDSTPVTKTSLKAACRELFDYPGDVLFYFSGHGALSPEGGYLATSEGKADDWGVSMQDIVHMANNSRATDILLILDCCHAGDMGDPGLLNPNGNAHPISALRENMTIIAAARNTQAAMEAGGHGLFTSALLNALDGGAADHMGWVTAPAIYSYVERRFNEWSQRPIYKSNASILNVVRKCAPLIDRFKLEELPVHFPAEDHKYQLDPEFEPEDEFGNLHEPVNKEKVRVAILLKEYRDAGLVRASEPGEQFYWAARRSHTVELTLRGREYWRLVKYDRLQ
jgi:caspase domain-containing protein